MYYLSASSVCNFLDFLKLYKVAPGMINVVSPWIMRSRARSHYSYEIEQLFSHQTKALPYNNDEHSSARAVLLYYGHQAMRKNGKNGNNSFRCDIRLCEAIKTTLLNIKIQI